MYIFLINYYLENMYRETTSTTQFILMIYVLICNNYKFYKASI